MAVPASTDEIEEFTPGSLKNAPVPPVFLLQPADGRESRSFEDQLVRAGLQPHTDATLRAEVLRGLKALWSPDVFSSEAARLQSFWALLDQGGDVDQLEAAAVAELSARVYRTWTPYAEMLADNIKFSRESLRIAASMFLAGWRGMKTAYTRENGMVPRNRVYDLERELFDMEEEAAKNNVEGVGEPGTAYKQLALAAYLRLTLTETERKNLPSPPPSSAALNGSTRKSSKRTRARSSKVSASFELPKA